MSAGAYIAGAYFGYVMPGGLEALHEVFQFAVSLNPFTDPIAQIGALYDGALHQTAATLHSVGEWLQSAGVEVSQRFREQIEQARVFLGPLLDQARELFCETWKSGSEAAVMLRDQVRNAMPAGESVITWTKEIAKTALDLISIAAEAYGIYEAGKAFYSKLLSKAKTEISAKVVLGPGDTPQVTDRSINLNINTAIGGGAVADTALRSREIRIDSGGDATRGLSALGSDQIIWISDTFSRQVTLGLNKIARDHGSARAHISLLSPSPVRTERAEDIDEDLRHRDRFPIINWGESALSGDRLADLKCGAALPVHKKMEIGISDQIPVRSNAKIIISEDGFLQVERPKPAKDTPDLLM